MLSLHRMDPASGGLGPAMFGRSTRRGKKLSFQPSVSLKRGEVYLARLTEGRRDLAERKYRIPRRTEQPDPPKVLAVYPTAKAIPANLLKFYIYFSEPMREGREVFDLIRIVDSKGRTVEAPWRQVELWDADARRLTLWIHPGRIKRGVSLRQMTGAVLRAGEEYQLVVDERVQAMSGAALKKAYSHRFRAIPEDRSAPAPGDWKMEIPMAGSRRELQVSASESFDHVLWKRHQWIEDARGRRVKGFVQLAEGEREWRFKPDRNWEPGRYQLCVDQWLEDLGGNGPGRPFERDVNTAETDPGVTRRSFRVP